MSRLVGNGETRGVILMMDTAPRDGVDGAGGADPAAEQAAQAAGATTADRA